MDTSWPDCQFACYISDGPTLSHPAFLPLKEMAEVFQKRKDSCTAIGCLLNAGRECSLWALCYR
jgi:hypothetical protein